MALHDYRRVIDLYGGGFVAVAVENTNIELRIMDAVGDVRHVTLSRYDAGGLLDHLAGAIKTIEGIK